MKPKTKIQHRIAELREGLLTSTYENEWAFEHCLEHRGFATKNRVICMDCGDKFSTELVSRKRAICPHCSTKLTIEKTNRRTDKQLAYFTTAEICEEFQVVRNYEVYGDYRVGVKKNTYLREVSQFWVHDDGKVEVVARVLHSGWQGLFFSGDLEIRNKYNMKKYDVYPDGIYPKSEFKPKFRKYGINSKLKGLTLFEAMTIIPNESKAETLLKAKMYGILSLFTNHTNSVYRFWNSIKICIRNKYRVSINNATIWTDYIELLDFFNKDLHNAHYVCPKNLKKAHDKFVLKKREFDRKIALERKKKKAIEDQKKFNELKSKYFGISFSDKKIQIKVLESVEEYVKEGEILHHCLYANSYHLKPNTLVLSARIDDTPIETIEISLEKFKVLQSRGKYNSETEYHNRILKLVNKNMNVFRNIKVG